MPVISMTKLVQNFRIRRVIEMFERRHKISQSKNNYRHKLTSETSPGPLAGYEISKGIN